MCGPCPILGYNNDYYCNLFPTTATPKTPPGQPAVTRLRSSGASECGMRSCVKRFAVGDKSHAFVVQLKLGRGGWSRWGGVAHDGCGEWVVRGRVQVVWFNRVSCVYLVAGWCGRHDGNACRGEMRGVVWFSILRMAVSSHVEAKQWGGVCGVCLLPGVCVCWNSAGRERVS